MAAYQHLLQSGIRVPEDISLICSGFNSTMTWSKPAITHLETEPERIIPHVVRWAANVARGRNDLKKTYIQAGFVEGGTIGPAKEE